MVVLAFFSIRMKLWSSEPLFLYDHRGVKAEADRLIDGSALVSKSYPEQIPTGTPDEGCLCVVLRTGFESSQVILPSL